MPSSVTSNHSFCSQASGSDTSVAFPIVDTSTTVESRIVAWGRSTLSEIAFVFDDPDEPPYTLVVSRIILVSDESRRSAAGGFWSSTLVTPIWLGGGATFTFCKSSHAHDSECSFSVWNKEGNEEENQGDEGHWIRPVDLLEARGPEVPVVECDGHTPPTPYMLELDAIKCYKDGERLEPCIFLRRIAAQSAPTDLRAFWAWLQRETGGSAPQCSVQIKEFTLRGLERDLVDTVDEDDKRMLVEVIKAIEEFDFSPGFAKPRKLVRREER